ncbi:hypothetical protein P885DRAFT_58856 [Corynascus similis CBS 632.67]
MADLKLHLREAVAEPTDVIKQGTAPPPYFFCLKPVVETGEEAEKFTALLSASGVARIFAAMDLVQSGAKNNGGGHYSLRNPSEYVAAFNEKTRTTVDTFLTGSMAAMYQPIPGGTTSKLDLEITRRDLHAMIVARIFDGLDRVDKTHRAELDKVLTSFTTALKPFKLPDGEKEPEKGKEDDDKDEKPSLKHAVVVNYVKSTDITGGRGGPGGIFTHQPCTRIVTFAVKPRQWAVALDKSPHQKPDPNPEPKPDPKPKPDPGEKPVVPESAPAPAGNSHDATAATHTSAKATTQGWGWWPKPKPKPEDEKIKFSLGTTIVELELDEDKFKNSKGRFEAVFKSFAKDDEVLGPIADSGGLKALGQSTCTIYRELSP